MRACKAYALYILVLLLPNFTVEHTIAFNLKPDAQNCLIKSTFPYVTAIRRFEDFRPVHTTTSYRNRGKASEVFIIAVPRNHLFSVCFYFQIAPNTCWRPASDDNYLILVHHLPSAAHLHFYQWRVFVRLEPTTTHFCGYVCPSCSACDLFWLSLRLLGLIVAEPKTSLNVFSTASDVEYGKRNHPGYLWISVGLDVGGWIIGTGRTTTCCCYCAFLRKAAATL